MSAVCVESARDGQACLVFSYGSNMSTARLRQRAPSAQPIGPGLITGHVLRWHKVSKDGSGKCDAAASDIADARVYGVLFEISKEDKRQLDRAEGLRAGYDEKKVLVDCCGKQYQALMYYATNIDPSLKPWSWYKTQVLAGAREHGMPPEYISTIESTEAAQDPDPERHAKQMLLASI